MESPERWRLARVDPSEPAYNGIYPNGRPSRSTVYTSFNPDGDPLESLLKDGGSPASILKSQPIIGYTLMALRANPWPIRVFTLTVTLQGVS